MRYILIKPTKNKFKDSNGGDMKKTSRNLGDIFLCGVSLLILFACMLTLLFSKDASFSEKENRALRTRPKVTFEKLLDGRYFSELTEFCSDQFPSRTLFTSTSTLIDLCLARKETNELIIANDGYLVARHDYKEFDTLKSNCEALSAFLKRTNDSGIPSFVFVAPRSIDVNEERLPSLYDSTITKEPYKILNKSISSSYLIEINNELKDRSKTEYIWYLTDHHWTTSGAYYAYLEISKKLQFDPLLKECFTVEAVNDSFLGTTFSRLGINDLKRKDTIMLYRYKDDDSFLVSEPSTNKTTFGFYDFDALSQFDKYKVFLGGNTDIIRIRDTTKYKPRLLLIKDSFANSIVPFLAIHYDIDMIDLRYYKGSIQKYMNENTFDSILVLYGIDTLSSDVSCSNILK